MKANRFRFRAWMKDDHQMRYIKMWSINCLIDADDIIPMQSTGLLDKNGVEIFEGDVVRSCMTGRRYVVCWSHEHCGWCKEQIGANVPDIPLAHDAIAMQVIGNVHENPELLESK